MYISTKPLYYYTFFNPYFGVKVETWFYIMPNPNKLLYKYYYSLSPGELTNDSLYFGNTYFMSVSCTSPKVNDLRMMSCNNIDFSLGSV